MPFSKILLVICIVLGYSGLESLVPEVIMFLSGYSTNPLSLKVRLPPHYFGLFKTLNQQAKGRLVYWGN